MTDRYIIPCAGNGNRWTEQTGTPKQLVKLCGEPILYRTVRQLHERGATDIRIIVKDLTDPRFKIPGTRRATAKLNPDNGPADKFCSSRHLWNRNGRTTILFGDVFFTDQAMDTIVNPDDGGDWRVYARFGTSNITGCRHPELFGITLHPDHHTLADQAIAYCVDLHQRGLLKGWSGGWQVYAAMCADTDLKARDRGHSVTIDDWTEDMDWRVDWERWCWHYAKADPADRPSRYIP